MPTLMNALATLEVRARRRRFARICQLLPRARPLRILDVGGTKAYWDSVGWAPLEPCEIVLFNSAAASVDDGPFRTEVGDARDLSRYPPGSFDVVLSNSVIEFVGGLEGQQRMADEVRRVGRLFVLQTPNAWFPLDWQTLMPFFHWLPADCKAWCHRRSRVGRRARARDQATAEWLATRVSALGKRELAALFPGCHIEHERVMGFTKSFIVHNADDRR